MKQLVFGSIFSALLIVAGTAAAGPNLVVGIADNDVAVDPTMHERLPAGLTMLRTFIYWQPGMTNLTARQHREVENALSGNSSLYVTVVCKHASCVAADTRERRIEYVSFTLDLVRSHPRLWGVGVWNEPNLPGFWPPQVRADQYMWLLAAVYRAISPTGKKVIGLEACPCGDPSGWVGRVAAAYRRAGPRRIGKLFDIAAIHVYSTTTWSPFVSPVSPFWISAYDVPYWRQRFIESFYNTPQRPASTPVWITETGYSTSGMVTYPGNFNEAGQAAAMEIATEVASCQEGVGAIFFFQQQDAPLWNTSLQASFRTGVINGAGHPKPSFVVLEQTTARIQAGEVNCKRFPRRALVPRPRPRLGARRYARVM
jgi:hypothetical protein